MHFPSGRDFDGAREWVTVGVRPHPGGPLLAAEFELYEDNTLQRDPGSGEVLLPILDLMYAYLLKGPIY